MTRVKSDADDDVEPIYVIMEAEESTATAKDSTTADQTNDTSHAKKKRSVVLILCGVILRLIRTVALGCIAALVAVWCVILLTGSEWPLNSQFSTIIEMWSQRSPGKSPSVPTVGTREPGGGKARRTPASGSRNASNSNVADSPIVSSRGKFDGISTNKLTLPGIAAEILPAGGGRFMVVRLTTSDVVVVDLEARKIVATHSTTDVDFMAASLSKLYFFSSERRSIRVASITDTKEAHTQIAVPEDDVLANAATGVATDSGTLVETRRKDLVGGVVRDVRKFYVLKPGASQLTPLEFPISGLAIADDDIHIRASENGLSFAFWRTRKKPSGVGLLTLSPFFDVVEHHYFHADINLATPRTFDRPWLIRANAVYPEVAAFQDAFVYRGESYPAETGRLLVSPVPGHPEKLLIEDPHQKSPLFGVTGKFPNRWPQDVSSKRLLTRDRRVQFVPHLNRLAILASDDQSVIIGDLDSQIETLRKENRVLSIPPTHLVAGETLDYQVATLATDDPPKLSLDFAPKGAVLDENGRLRWTAPQSKTQSLEPFVISIRPAGTDSSTAAEDFHAFTLHVQPTPEI